MRLLTQVCCLILLAGCGQKGPLFLPKPQPLSIVQGTPALYTTPHSQLPGSANIIDTFSPPQYLQKEYRQKEYRQENQPPII